MMPFSNTIFKVTFCSLFIVNSSWAITPDGERIGIPVVQQRPQPQQPYTPQQRPQQPYIPQQQPQQPYIPQQQPQQPYTPQQRSQQPYTPQQRPQNLSSTNKALPMIEITEYNVNKFLGINQPISRTIDSLKKDGFGSMVQFKTGSNEVIPSNGLRVILKSLLNLEPNARILITGYTDNRGGKQFNQNLAFHRAASVRRWFEKNGVRKGAIEIHGAGIEAPIASNETEEGRRKNRRVEFSRLKEN